MTTILLRKTIHNSPKKGRLSQTKAMVIIMSVILEAHRGLSAYYPENTLAAFRAARDRGYGMIELDTKFTADNVCVCLHNKTVNKTARRPDGTALEEETPITALTFAEARALDYGLWKGEQFRGEPIPTLDEALAFSAEAGIPLKFDNVLQRADDTQLEIFFSTVERMDALSHIGFTANRIDFIEKVMARFPAAQIHYDGDISENALAAVAQIVPAEQLTVWLRYHNNRTAWCKTPACDAALVAMTRRYARRIGLWLLDKPEELVDAEAWGVDLVETEGELRP
ncbi:MAG: hypothetical protein E7654_07700 [Ruminococcaceae bacterium]|nr:hypothetical protein [Oscillospiraceae bacterium]